MSKNLYYDVETINNLVLTGYSLPDKDHPAWKRIKEFIKEAQNKIDKNDLDDLVENWSKDTAEIGARVDGARAFISWIKNNTK